MAEDVRAYTRTKIAWKHTLGSETKRPSSSMRWLYIACAELPATHALARLHLHK